MIGLVLTTAMVWIITIHPPTTYYVDCRAATSGDGLSQATAWNSIADVNAAMSGFGPNDKILFRRGTSCGGPDALDVTASHITIGTYGNGPDPKLNVTHPLAAVLGDPNSSFVVIRDLVLNSMDRGLDTKGAWNWTLRRLEASGNTGSGFISRDGGNTTIDNCIASDNGLDGIRGTNSDCLRVRWAECKGNKRHGIQVADASDIVIEGCTARESGTPMGMGVVSGTGNGIEASMVSQIAIIRNAASLNLADGVHVTKSKHVEISGNVITDHNGFDSADGIQSAGGDDVIISGNLVAGSRNAGIILSDVSGFLSNGQIFANVVRDSVGVASKQGITLKVNAPEVTRVYNNTVLNKTEACVLVSDILSLGGGVTEPPIRIYNNILYSQDGTAPSGQGSTTLKVGASHSTSAYVWTDHNGYWADGHLRLYKWGNQFCNDGMLTGCDLSGGTNCGLPDANSLFCDPEFEDPLLQDLSLSSNSEYIGAGLHNPPDSPAPDYDFWGVPFSKCDPECPDIGAFAF